MGMPLIDWTGIDAYFVFLLAIGSRFVLVAAPYAIAFQIFILLQRFIKTRPSLLTEGTVEYLFQEGSFIQKTLCFFRYIKCLI